MYLYFTKYKYYSNTPIYLYKLSIFINITHNLLNRYKRRDKSS